MPTLIAVATVVLVLVTTWYAYSTHQILKQMSRQAETMTQSTLATALALHAGTGPHKTELELLARKLHAKLEAGLRA